MPLLSDIQQILADAVEIESEVERQAFVRQACGGNGDLEQQIHELIASYSQAGAFLEAPALCDFPTKMAHGRNGDDSGCNAPGTMIGPYKLLEQIGAGGMGTVYVAEQKVPVRRTVALKVIKPGMDTREVIARFEAERQALALMDHPHIARVLDAGTTDAGRPYFVMELVRGLPITEYCDQARLPIPARLTLFVQVCHAVQHAHQKGIIHRDLKPSNVLVALVDGVPVPKVIDFGIAKAINQRLGEHTVYTRHMQLLGSPLYMSPEQAGFGDPDVDTRSDVYSLGVLLYELLTGTTPFDNATLSKADLDELRRIFREVEPATMSSRIGTLPNHLQTTVSASRGVDTRTLVRQTRGELDWIVRKALEKDRSRRYESVSALAADLECYLHNEPVEAGPPSTAYRVIKFTRRNRGALVTAALLIVTLLAGTGVSVWQAVEAVAARKRADENFALATQRLEGEKVARQEAETQRQQAQQAEAREAAQRQRAEVGLEIAMQGLDRTVQTLVDQRWIPQLRGSHRQLIEESLTLFNRLIELKPGDSDMHVLRGQVYEALGHPDDVVADYTAAIDLDSTNHRAHYRLANFYSTFSDVSKRDSGKAIAHIQRAVALSPDVQEYKICHASITAKFVKPYPASSRQLFEEAILLNPQNSVAYSSRADMAAGHGDFQAALDDALKARELDGENYEAHRQLGRALSGLGRYEKALESLDSAKALAPYQHYVYRDRADCLFELGKFEEAVNEYSAGWQLARDHYIYPQRRAKAHFALSQYRQSLADIATTIELAPNNTYVLTIIPPAAVAACPDESFRIGLLALADNAVERLNGSEAARVSRAALQIALGNLAAARSDLDLSVALPKAGHYARYQHALLCLAMHDNAAYRDDCATMLREFGDSQNAEQLHFCVCACALAPDAVADIDKAIRLGHRAVEISQRTQQCLQSYGAALFRAGRLEDALKALEESEAATASTATPASYGQYFLAMTCFNLGQQAQSRAWFDKAAKSTAEMFADKSHARLAAVPWNSRMTLELLDSEASELLGVPADTDASDDSKHSEIQKNLK